MSDAYPIFTVEPEWMLEPEYMGSKSKFWYRRMDADTPAWLFKYPQANTGQHWAEKIAAEVAGHMQITHGKVELAMFQGEHGSATESFAHGGLELFHGNELLEITIVDYDPKAKFHHSHHTLALLHERNDCKKQGS